MGRFTDYVTRQREQQRQEQSAPVRRTVVGDSWAPVVEDAAPEDNLGTGRPALYGGLRRAALADRAFSVGDRVRDTGDGRTGVVVEVSRWEVRWKPEQQRIRFREEIFASHPSMLERV